jgi:hypothetical protein
LRAIVEHQGLDWSAGATEEHQGLDWSAGARVSIRIASLEHREHREHREASQPRPRLAARKHYQINIFKTKNQKKIKHKGR